MKSRAGGFTIVEVLITLAITGLLLIAAASLLKGQTGETAFQQSMHDLNSKLDSTIKTVSNNLFPNADQYKCSLNTTTQQPELTVEAGHEVGGNEACIYLGIAIEVAPKTANTKVYTVLGRRNYVPDPANPGEVVNVPDLLTAKPTPITSLTEDFSPYKGAELVRAYYSSAANPNPAGQFDMAGFYNNPAGTASGAGGLLIRAYQKDNSTVGNFGTNADKFILQNNASFPGVQPINHWFLCYQNPNNNSQKALIDVTTTNAGVSSRVDFKACQ